MPEDVFVYEACYCPCIHESGPVTVSIHRTRQGAEKALAWHKEEIRKRHEDIYNGRKEPFPFDAHQSWFVDETKLLD